MRPILLLLFLLLPAVVLAQPAPSGGSCPANATCKAKQFSLLAGNKLCLNSTTCTDIISASATTAGMLFNSAVTNAGTNVAYIFDTTNVLSGNTLIASFKSGGTQQLSIDNAGQILGTFATPQKINMSSGANGISLSTGSVGGGSVVVLDSGSNQFFAVTATGISTGSVTNPVPVVHAAQTTSPVAMEFARTAASAGGVLAVTFATAFNTAPACTCSDENAVPVVCGISVAPTINGVTFAITAARADTLDWQCIGLK